QGLRPIARSLRARLELHPSHAQMEPLEKQERHDELRLVWQHDASEAPLFTRLLLGEGEEPDLNVRILVGIVRMRMVTIVFLIPPRSAEPEQQRPGQELKGIGRAAGRNELAVRDVVQQEPQL